MVNFYFRPKIQFMNLNKSKVFEDEESSERLYMIFH
jgi:hypothetical protein